MSACAATASCRPSIPPPAGPVIPNGPGLGLSARWWVIPGGPGWVGRGGARHRVHVDVVAGVFVDAGVDVFDLVRADFHGGIFNDFDLVGIFTYFTGCGLIAKGVLW